jgi:NADH-quinone oxidoreductase subunit L
MALYALFGTLDLPEMARLLENGQAPAHPVWPWLAGIGLALGAMGKSAQLPFSVWLPDAMEGPTPVSALLHAATMVAAGVYLLARCHFLLPGSVQEALLWVGALTALYGAFSALAQTDLKKVLAFSTISQLGYMFMALGAGAPGLAMFHLLTHAFFKAGLFLGAGSVIHALHDAGHRQGLHLDAQDLRLMGGLRKALPFTAAAFALCGFSLAGLPLFSGFLSKDAILITIWEKGHWMPFILGMLAALGTAFYVGRLLFLVFWGDDIRAKGLAVGQVSEGSWAMRFPMGLLALLSAWIWFSWHPADAGSGWMLQGLGQQTAHGFSGWMIGGGSALGAVLMLALAWGIYVRGHRWKDRLFPAHSLLRRWSEQACYLPRAYQTAVALLLGLSRGSAWLDRKVIDAGIDRAGIAAVVLAHIGAFLDRWAVDGLVNGTAKTIGAAGKSSLYLLQQGKVQGYIATAMAGLLLLLSLLG